MFLIVLGELSKRVMKVWKWIPCEARGSSSSNAAMTVPFSPFDLIQFGHEV